MFKGFDIKHVFLFTFCRENGCLIVVIGRWLDIFKDRYLLMCVYQCVE